MSNNNHFPHIDGLRAIAVLAVIIFHYNEALLPGGYLGVDLFFVVSGFVITGYLIRIDPGNIAPLLLDFYVRRFKRLVPALLFCSGVTVIAFTLLTTRPSIDIFRTSAAAVLGMSNNYLFLRSADYFSLDAALNPFTHTWSLGVEEQFYLIYPGLLAALGIYKKGSKSSVIFYIMLAITLCSIIGFVIFSNLHPPAAFYLLPFRLWELMAGGIAYLYMREYLVGMKSPVAAKLLSHSSLIVVIACFFVPSKYQIASTIVMVFCTIFILLDSRKDSFIRKLLSTPYLLWIGLLSYSLYIWHWPVLLLSKSIIGTNIFMPIIAIPTTIALASFSYYFVERPLRYSSWGGFRLQGAAYLSIMLIAAVMLAFIAPKHISSYNNTLARAFDVPPVEEWTDDVDCHGAKDLESKSNPLEDCLGAERSKSKPNVLYLLGDSHAAQLYFMFESGLNDSSYQLKFINDGAISALIQGHSNVAAFEYILSNARPQDIVAVAFHRGHLNENRDRHLDTGSKINPNKKTLSLLTGLSNYLSQLNNIGVNTLFIRDTPLMNSVTTSPSCRLQIELFGSSSCKVSLKQDLHTRIRQDYVFDQLIDNFPKSCSWDPILPIYNGAHQLEVVNAAGEYIMWDWNHISKKESKRLGHAFGLAFKDCISASKI